MVAEARWASTKETAWDLVVLPWGATEPHNLHLPYGTDVFETDAIAAEAGRIAWEAGARVAVLPTVPFGANAGQRTLALTVDVRPSTQLALLRDVAESLVAQGILRLVVLNGHGGNDFRAAIRELQGRVPLLVCLVDWFRIPIEEPPFTEAGDHAGELETSLMAHVAPDLTGSPAEAGRGRTRPFKVAALREGWAWTPRDWPRATSDTGSGDPAAATAEKGRRYFGAVTGKLAAFLVELSATDPGRLYEGE
jgi:creatinine amidohydrolase